MLELFRAFELARATLQFPAPPLKTPTTVGVFVFCADGGP